jgi:tellurite resistance protein TehA-like permease
MISSVARTSPVYFSMVMATGIISSAAQLLGMPLLAMILFWITALTFAAVCVSTGVRIAIGGREFFAEIIDHRLGPVYFTSVAACCVLGSQCVLVLHGYTIAIILWLVAMALWICLTYAFFIGVTVKETKPALDDGISGAWLLAVVATQAIALLGALIAPHFQQPYRLEINFLAFSMWLWGGMLYIWMISLIFYRYAFFAFSPGDLAPPYWVNMGAMAISTLAGSLLVINAPDAPFIRSLLPFLKGFTVFYWATGTWWIPMLAILAVWRHFYRRFPLRYDPLYWGAVFPLGMYTAATFRMAQALKLEFLFAFPRAFIFIALGAWVLTFAGLLRVIVERLLRSVRSRSAAA